jgi:hypothetical protein
LSGDCARPCDHGQFIKRNRRVFDEDRVGQIGPGGQAHNTNAESREAFFVTSVLLDRFGDVNILARKESQLAIAKIGADGSSEGCEHIYRFAALS